MDYDNLSWEGILEDILYQEKRRPEESTHDIVSPRGAITTTRLKIACNDGGGFMPEFMAGVPKRLIGKEVTFKQSLKTEGDLQTLTQELIASGMGPIVTHVTYRV